MTIDFQALAQKAVELGADQTKATTGGGERALPVAGPALCRFVSYVETGKHTKIFKGVANVVDEVQLTFELVGKNYPPTELPDGAQLPHRITITEKLSFNEKANFYKLFNRLKVVKPDAQHMAQLLGAGFKCEVVHDKWVGKDGKDRVTAELRNEAGYTLAPARRESDDGSEWVNITVPPAISPIKVFIWSIADLEQWSSLYIAGDYPERKNDKGEVTAPAKSKNVLQHRIMVAKNFNGSPIHTLLVAGGAKLDIPTVADQVDEEDSPAAPASPPAQKPAAAPADDALGGIV